MAHYDGIREADTNNYIIALEGTIKKLEAIVGRLPVTQGGVPITPGMEVWHLVGGLDTSGQERAEPMIMPSGRLSLTGVMYCPEWPTFSTRAAAVEAARKALVGGSQ